VLVDEYLLEDPEVGLCPAVGDVPRVVDREDLPPRGRQQVPGAVDGEQVAQLGGRPTGKPGEAVERLQWLAPAVDGSALVGKLELLAIMRSASKCQQMGRAARTAALICGTASSSLQVPGWMTRVISSRPSNAAAQVASRLGSLPSSSANASTATLRAPIIGCLLGLSGRAPHAPLLGSALRGGC
jgi:hypothetical protein